MFVKELNLKNFKSFKSFNIALNEGVNVIAGENGVGKTTILEAIAKGIGGNPFYKSRIGISSNRSETKINKINTDDVTRLHEDELQFPTEIGITLQQEKSRYIATRFLKDRAKREDSFDFSALYPKFTSASFARHNAEEGLPLLRYYSSGRAYKSSKRTSRKQELFFGNRLSAYTDCMLPKENFNFLEYWLNGKGLAYLERYAGDDRAREIVESCYDIVPGLKLVGLNRNRDGILYSFSKKKAVLPIEYLSDGQRILLAMVLDLLLRCEVLNYRAYRRNVFNNTDGVVLIDEIDMHLHPKWQREVIGNLKKFFPKVQFIITTHSPFVIQSLGEGELIAFSSDMSEISRNVGGLSLEEIAEEIQGVPMAHLSKKKMEMLSAAEDVFNRLKEYKHRELPLNLRRQIAQELIAKIAPYSDDVAYFAYLKTNIKDFLNTYENS